MTLTLSAVARPDKKPNALRAEGLIPVVVYGQGKEAQHVAVDARAFMKVYKTAGESTLVDLVVQGGAQQKVVIHDIQTDPLSDACIHADLYHVDMHATMHVTIPLDFTGVAPAVKEQGGVLVKSVSSIHVECLPNDLVHGITVDLGQLTAFGQSIRLRDLTLPPGLKLLDHPEETAVSVAAPRSEAQLEAELTTAPEAGVESVEVEKKGKVEAEGAADDATTGSADGKEEDKKTEKKTEKK